MIKTPSSLSGDPGLIPGQGTRFHMPQLRPDGAKKKKKVSSRKNDLLIQNDRESYN